MSLTIIQKIIHDLLCKKDGKKLFIEVKGTQPSAQEIILTRGEVEFMNKHKSNMGLFIVRNIAVDKDKKLSGGEDLPIESFVIKKGNLVVISYTYTIDDAP